MKILKTLLIALVLTALPAAVWAADKLTVMTHDSFNVSEEALAEFEAANGVEVRFLKSGDAGEALNKAILSKNNPLADLFFGVDNTFLSRALNAGIFEPYRSPRLADVPDDLQLDDQYRVSPVDFGDVCLNYDKNWFKQHDLAPPQDLTDLTEPAYKGLTVVENPATSSPGLAFLLATIGRFGEDGYLDYWKQLKANGVKVTNGWEEAFYGDFTAASDGRRPIVVSYASSPPVMVYFSEKPLDESPIAAVTAPKNAFRQIEFVGILKGTEKRELAEKMVDFMLGPAFQADIPLQMYMFPANQTVELPEIFTEYGGRAAEEPVRVDYDRIEEKRDDWIQAWTQTVLR
jgi:thiamine transport system substrate-binding protein